MISTAFMSSKLLPIFCGHYLQYRLCFWCFPWNWLSIAYVFNVILKWFVDFILFACPKPKPKVWGKFNADRSFNHTHSHIMVVYFDLFKLWTWWTCDSSIQYIWWATLSKRMVFVSTWFSTNASDFHVTHTTADIYSWLCKYRMYTKCFQKSKRHLERKKSMNFSRTKVFEMQIDQQTFPIFSIFFPDRTWRVFVFYDASENEWIDLN